MAAVRFTLADGVARIVFDRPAALNAIDVATAEALLAVCEDLRAQKDLRVIVLSGAGRAFMAGGDLAAFRAAEDKPALAAAIIEPLHRALALLAELPQPVIGSVHGAVSGAGMSLAIGCDLTLAAADTRFCLAYVGIGTSLDGGASWQLPRLVGLQRAMQLALLNQPLSADEACRLGLIARVVPGAELEAETAALAARLAAGPAFAQGRIKRLLRRSAERRYGEQLDAELEAFRACAATADFREGLDAFFGKRKPSYRGTGD